MEKEKREKKKPTVKTLEDKGTKIDFADFGDGRQVFIYQEEKFRGFGIGGFKIGLTDKYKVISPQELTSGTITTLSNVVSNVSGDIVKVGDFEIHIVKKRKKKREEIK